MHAAKHKHRSDADDEAGDQYLDSASDSHSEHGASGYEASDVDADENITGRAVLLAKATRTDKRADINDHKLLADHLQTLTHFACMRRKSCLCVPMFLGGLLPSRNKGDREEYCITMLSLFKPFRMGLDLKGSKITWAEKFEHHQLDEEAKEEKKFFNTKYECGDARDNFRARRIAGEGQTGVPVGWVPDHDDPDANDTFIRDGCEDDTAVFDPFGHESLQSARHQARME